MEEGRYGFGIASSVDFHIEPEHVLQWREMLWTGQGWGWDTFDTFKISCTESSTRARTDEEIIEDYDYYQYDDNERKRRSLPPASESLSPQV